MLIRSFVKHDTILCGGCNTTAPLAQHLTVIRYIYVDLHQRGNAEIWGWARLAQRRDRKENQTATKLKMSHCISVHWH